MTYVVRWDVWRETGIGGGEEDYMMGLWQSGRRTGERIKGRMGGGIEDGGDCGGERRDG